MRLPARSAGFSIPFERSATTPDADTSCTMATENELIAGVVGVEADHRVGVRKPHVVGARGNFCDRVAGSIAAVECHIDAQPADRCRPSPGP